MTPTRFRRRPLTVEAVLYDGTPESVDAIHGWLEGVVTTEGAISGLGVTLTVEWRGMRAVVTRGEWLVVDENGQLGRIDDDSLAWDYEPEGEGNESSGH